MLALSRLVSHDLLEYNHAQSPNSSELQNLAYLCYSHAHIAPKLDF